MARDKIPVLIQEILTARGYKNEEEIRSFLFSGISSLSDPFAIPALKQATEMLADAISQEKKIFLYGDGDVDGICAVFLILSFMNGHGIKTPFYLTHRLDENYEIETSFINELKETGYSILITMDCGISSITALEQAEKVGIKCIIIDHHIGFPQQLPRSHIYINPFVDKWDNHIRYLSGAGITFKFIAGMEQLLPGGVMGKKVSDMFEVPCLATLADFVPLTGENRIFVKEGLKKIPFTSINGLQYMLNYYNIVSPISTRDIIMKINPKLNSPGRFGKPDITLELLLENNMSEVEKLVEEIDTIDRERYKTVAKIMKEIDTTSDDNNGFILSENDYKGLSGIIASRLSEKYNRPFLVCYEKNNIIKGSIRTPEGYYFHNTSELKKYMDEIGGHQNAVGFKCSSVYADQLRNAWDATEWHTEEPKTYDCELDIQNLTPRLIKEIFQYLEPFGKGNPVPVFLCRDVCIKNIRVENGPLKRCWIKKKECLFESIITDNIHIPVTEEKTDIYYTPYIKESNGLYRIFLKIYGLKNHRFSAGG